MIKSESENKKVRKPRRNHKRERAVQKIINNAIDGGENKLSRELTFQQALSIHLRSDQLANEGRDRPHLITNKEKAHQVDVCWKQRMEL